MERRDSLGDVFLKDAPSAELINALGGQPTLSGRSVTVDSALGLVHVFAAVRVLAESIGVMPCHVYRRQSRGRTKAEDVWQYRLFHESPNSEQAPGQFFETLVGHMALWGNCYVEKIPYVVAGSPRVGELWPIAPNRVRPFRRKSDGAKQFEVDGGKALGEDSILHIPAFGYDGLSGLSPVGVCRQQLGIALARDDYHARFYANNANPGGIIKRPLEAKTISDQGVARLQADWESKHQGANAHRVAILEEGMDYVQTGIPLADQQFIEQGQFTATQIAVMFNMPASKINGQTGESLTLLHA
jgi:HK97 family phage portal protein